MPIGDVKVFNLIYIYNRISKVSRQRAFEFDISLALHECIIPRALLLLLSKLNIRLRSSWTTDRDCRSSVSLTLVGIIEPASY